MDLQFSAGQLARGRELVSADREARLELGDLLLDVAPWSTDVAAPGPDTADQAVTTFAAAIGLSAAQARRYRKVAWTVRQYGRDVFAETGVTVSYAALSAAMLRSGGSVELLLDVCRTAAAEGRTQITVADVETARRAVVRAAADERRLQKASEQADRSRSEKQERLQALAPYRAGIERLVAARVADGADASDAEAAVVGEIAERIIGGGGNPGDLLELDSEVVARQVDVIRAARRRAGELRSINRRLGSAENALRQLTDHQALGAGSDQIGEQWLATLDRIITHSVDLAERIRGRADAAE